MVSISLSPRKRATGRSHECERGTQECVRHDRRGFFMIPAIITGIVSQISGVTFAILAISGVVSAQGTAPPAMTLLVDETQAARRIAFVHEEIRVRPGPFALAFPRWIPCEHGPTGPIQQIAALRIRSGNATLPWTRDPDDINTIHVTVPAGIDAITVEFDTLLENTIS